MTVIKTSSHHVFVVALLLLLLLQSTSTTLLHATTISDACPSACSTQGTCVDGICSCFRGYSGIDCSEAGCLNDCSYNGKCKDPRFDFEENLTVPICLCGEGWDGVDCSINLSGTVLKYNYDECPDNCNGNGICVHGVCECDHTHRGTTCAERYCNAHTTCSGQGMCTEKLTCDCFEGFGGNNCDFKLCSNDKNRNQHCNHGECVIIDGGNSMCICDEYYTGALCNEVKCSGGCYSGDCMLLPLSPDTTTATTTTTTATTTATTTTAATTTAAATTTTAATSTTTATTTTTGSPMCVCKTGFTGYDCSTPTCIVDSDGVVCAGNGVCHDGECYCKLGYKHPHCIEKECVFDCNGNGICNNGECECFDGFMGDACGAVGGSVSDLKPRADICLHKCSGPGCDRCLNGCSNNGSCNIDTDVCECDEGYAGADCSSIDNCLSGCNGNGNCKNNVCVCSSGFTGSSCLEKTCLSDCHGHGKCIDGVCACSETWSGDSCDVHQCNSSNEYQCSGYGYCKDSVCHCVGHFDYPYQDQPRFRGDDCSKHMCPTTNINLICGGNGTCNNNDGVCVCKTGFTGIACEEHSD